MANDLVIVGLPIVGTAFGVLITSAFGYMVAKRSGIDKITLHEMSTRAEFFNNVAKRYDELEKKYLAVLEDNRVLRDKLSDANSILDAHGLAPLINET